ncbi:hypothetical protein MASR2M15_29250 [Anaerolineales bacterium]
MTPFLLEIIADSVQSAQIAQESGAHRLEIVASLESGGISPSLRDGAEDTRDKPVTFDGDDSAACRGFCVYRG